MNIYPDAIFIGAINYDYIFQIDKQHSNNSLKKQIETGPEALRWDKRNGSFDIKIQDMYENFTFISKQIGGSAYLALKAFKAADPSLKAAYVGACGHPTQMDIDRKINFNEKDFKNIDNKEWFFSYYNNKESDDKYALGRACVLLKSDSTRDNIVIDPGINDLLLKLIKNKELNGRSFTDFLTKSRWIHITSFSDFDVFQGMINYIKEAKLLNPFLRISCDLGSEYTGVKRHELISKGIFDVFDFIFLNNDEKNNLIVNPSTSKRKQNNNLKKLFQQNNLRNQQILVTKYENRYELYNMVDDHIQIKKFWQQRLSKNDIVNDTGAGDFFAGGFIAGILSNKLLSHQPAPIEVGSIVAKERLKANLVDTACANITPRVNKYIKELFKDDELNIGQYIRIKWDKVKNAWIFSVIVSFIIGIITGIIVQWYF